MDQCAECIRVNDASNIKTIQCRASANKSLHTSVQRTKWPKNTLCDITYRQEYWIISCFNLKNHQCLTLCQYLSKIVLICQKIQTWLCCYGQYNEVQIFAMGHYTKPLHTLYTQIYQMNVISLFRS